MYHEILVNSSEKVFIFQDFQDLHITSITQHLAGHQLA